MKITVTINGSSITLEGDIDTIQNAAKKLGVNLYDESLFYHSQTHGFIPIKNMDTNHIKNALLKAYGEWFTGLRQLPLADICREIASGPTSKTIAALYSELLKRI